MQQKYNETRTTTEPTVEETWKTIKRSITAAASEILGQTPANRPIWMSSETWDKIDERAKVKTLRDSCTDPTLLDLYRIEYRMKDKEVKRCARLDKRRHLDSQIQEAEDAAQRNDSAELFKITRQICGEKRQTSDAVRNTDGSLITDTEGAKEVWRQYFHNLLNRPSPTLPFEPAQVASNLNIPQLEPINVDPPSVNEISASINKLKNRKAPGEDQIHPEFLKCCNVTTSQMLHTLITQIWNEETCPQDWIDGEIVTLHKKGDKTNCNNYSGITLLSVPGKVLANILLERIRQPVMKVLRQNQAGFLPGKSCSDQIHNLRCILQQANEFNSPIACCFVDYEKAFDSPHRPTLWRILDLYGIPTKIIGLIKALHHNSQSCVRLATTTTEKFPVTTGVRQGCVLAPFLFVILIDFVLRLSTNNEEGIQFQSDTKLCDLEYADDAVLLETSLANLSSALECLQRYSAVVGLNINKSKTVSLINESVIDANAQVMLDGQPIEDVEYFKYLGTFTERDGTMHRELSTRLALAGAAFSKLGRIWKSTIFGTKTKVRLYNACVLPVLLYGCESWHPTCAQNTRLAGFESKCLRRMLGIRWYDFVPNTTVRELTGQPYVTNTVKFRRLTWLGHVLRKPAGDYTRLSLNYHPEGNRRRGRPLQTIRRLYEADLRGAGVEWDEAVEVAGDRAAWRGLVESICSI
jgi:hypothetical protein